MFRNVDIENVAHNALFSVLKYGMVSSALRCVVRTDASLGDVRGATRSPAMEN